MSIAEWEASKENVQPRARGRDPNKLNAVLRPSRTAAIEQAKQRDVQKQEFERAIEAAVDSDDPLAPWIRYVAWAEQAYPSDSLDNHVLHILEECTRLFKDDERYRNKLGYLKLWVKYADKLSDPAEVFKFLYANKIGSDLALFYMAWALVAEKRGNYAFADKVYKRGIARKATPLHRLERRYQEFTKRMKRLWLRHSQELVTQSQPTNSSDHDLDNIENVNLDTLTNAVKQEAQSGEFTERQSSQRQSGHDENHDPLQVSERQSRRPLAGITARQAGLSHRNTDSADTTDANVMNSNSANNNSSSNTATGGNFSIFVEEPFAEKEEGDKNVDTRDDLDRTRSSANQPNTWKSLPTQAELSKENMMKPSKWTDAALDQHEGTVQPSHMAATAPASSVQDLPFQIFQDNDVSMSEPSTRTHGGVGLKPRQEGEISSTEAIVRDPLRAHKQAGQTSSKNTQSHGEQIHSKETKQPKRLNVSEEPKQKKGEELAYDVHAVNGRANVPLPGSKSQAVNTGKIAYKVACYVHGKRSNPPRRSELSFEEIRMLAYYASNDTNVSANAASETTHAIQTPARSDMSHSMQTPNRSNTSLRNFGKHTQTPKGLRGNNMQRARSPLQRSDSSGKKHGNRVTRSPLRTPARVSNHNSLASKKISQVMAADNEDVTINTRLAMEDLGDLFASPSASFMANQTSLKKQNKQGNSTQNRKLSPVRTQFYKDATKQSQSFTIFDENVDSQSATKCSQPTLSDNTKQHAVPQEPLNSSMTASTGAIADLMESLQDRRIGKDSRQHGAAVPTSRMSGMSQVGTHRNLTKQRQTSPSLSPIANEHTSHSNLLSNSFLNRSEPFTTQQAHKPENSAQESLTNKTTATMPSATARHLSFAIYEDTCEENTDLSDIENKTPPRGKSFQHVRPTNVQQEARAHGVLSDITPPSVSESSQRHKISVSGPTQDKITITEYDDHYSIVDDQSQES